MVYKVVDRNVMRVGANRWLCPSIACEEDGGIVADPAEVLDPAPNVFGRCICVLGPPSNEANSASVRRERVELSLLFPTSMTLSSGRQVGQHAVGERPKSVKRLSTALADFGVLAFSTAVTPLRRTKPYVETHQNKNEICRRQ